MSHSAPLPNVLRTADERFSELPDYPFEPHYIDRLPATPGLRVHYVDEGPPDAAVTVLCLHGQPSWSYLYRKMIPRFVAAGQRVIAPDLLGFGRSDKPQDEAFYSFSGHRQMLLDFIELMQLDHLTLVVQDWGGLLGLTLPMDLGSRVERLLVMNTALATGDVPLGEGFHAWRKFANSQPDLDVAALMRRAAPELTEAEASAYAAPFPDARYKAGVRRFPNLVPDAPNADGAALSRRALKWWSEQWQGQSFMAIGMQDPVLGPPVMRALRKVIRGCPEPLELPDAGHFVQEVGAPIVDAALASFADA